MSVCVAIVATSVLIMSAPFYFLLFAGNRSYFVVLCVAQLLDPKKRVIEAKEDKQDMYYMSCLIKVIQVYANQIADFHTN